MTYTGTYNSDFNLDLSKNQDLPVCSSFKSPRNIQCVSNVLTDNSRPSRMGVENSCGDYFCMIPVRNAGEGQQL